MLRLLGVGAVLLTEAPFVDFEIIFLLSNLDQNTIDYYIAHPYERESYCTAMI